MNNKLRALMLAALTVSGSAFATEHRTPYLSDRGPLRHSFKKLHKKKMNINTWSTVHSKEAHKAFMKHGTDTKELTALLFNKETFAFREIFPNADVPLGSPNYNPFMRTLSYSPRAKYFEYGATFGGQLDFPVWKDQKTGESKGRIGVRASIPVRTVEVERQDITPIGASIDSDLGSVVKSGVVRVTQNNAGAAGAAGTATDVLATAYRLDFVQSIRDAAGASVLNAVAPSTPGTTHDGTVSLFGQNIAVTAKENATVGLAFNVVDHPQVFAWQRDTTAATSVPASKFANPQITFTDNALATADGEVKVFNDTVNYSAINGLATTVLAKAGGEAWLIFQRGADANNDRRLTGANAQAIERMIQDRIRAFNVDAFTFMANNGFLFDSFKRSGLGDIDFDVFYEHEISEKLLAEVVLGVRFPTGSSKNSCNNPYRAIAKLGNGEHFEVKLGANASWECCKWLSMKADVSYNFVLEDKEKRAAVFEKSTVKNIGPCVEADVDWGYFIGRLDFQVHHPKSHSLSTVLGYEFYYKTEDHVTFKVKTAQSWLGTDANLDNKLARANTESISHKGRFESRWKPNRWLEVFCGGSMVFAGQNAFRDFDAHGGFNVRY